MTYLLAIGNMEIKHKINIIRKLIKLVPPWMMFQLNPAQLQHLTLPRTILIALTVMSQIKCLISKLGSASNARRVKFLTMRNTNVKLSAHLEHSLIRSQKNANKLFLILIVVHAHKISLSGILKHQDVLDAHMINLYIYQAQKHAFNVLKITTILQKLDNAFMNNALLENILILSHQLARKMDN